MVHRAHIRIVFIFWLQRIWTPVSDRLTSIHIRRSVPPKRSSTPTQDLGLLPRRSRRHNKKLLSTQDIAVMVPTDHHPSWF